MLEKLGGWNNLATSSDKKGSCLGELNEINLIC